MGLKLKQAQKAFMEVPNMNHCSPDARRASPVLLREPPHPVEEQPEGRRAGG